MKVLAIVNRDDTPPGRIGVCVERMGGACVPFNPHRDGPLPAEAAGFDGLLLLGGPMSVMDEDLAPVFDPILGLVRAFHAEEKPVLGICLGAQMIAKAFGQPVFPAPEFQVGFPELTLTEMAKEESLFAGLAPTQRLFVHHKETFELPEGAVLLMESSAVRNHAFRLGRATFGFQSHPEATAEIIRTWLQRRPSRAVQHLGERGWQLLAAAEADIARHIEGSLRFADAVGGRWARHVRGCAERARRPRGNEGPLDAVSPLSRHERGRI